MKGILLLSMFYTLILVGMAYCVYFPTVEGYQRLIDLY